MKLSLPARFALFGFVVAGFGILGISAYSYRDASTLLRKQSVGLMGGELLRLTSKFQENIDRVRLDVQRTATSDSILGYQRAVVGDGYDGERNMTVDLWKQRLAIDFKLLLEQRPDYLQIRYIGVADDGMELVRVERREGKVIVIQDKNLQEKGQNSYVQETIKLKSQEQYLSQVQLNKEHGTIVFPLQSVMRVAAPIYTENGVVFGVVVINADFNALANPFEDAPPNVSFMLADEEGDYLFHPDKNQQFTLALGGEAGMKKDFPISDHVNETHDKYELLDLPNQSANLIHTRLHYNPLDQNRHIFIGARVSHSVIEELSQGFGQRLAFGVIVVVLLISIGMAQLAKRLTKPVKLLTIAADRIAKGDRAIIPAVDRKDELGTLAKSFQTMVHHLNASQNEMKTLAESLETQVEERTQELVESREHALKMAEDAKTAKEEIEITAERANLALQELESQKSALDEHAIVSITDNHGRITYVNDKFCDISKYAREDLIGQDHRIVNSSHHPREFFRELWKTIREGKVWKGEVKNKTKDGEFYWVETSIIPFKDKNGNISQFVSIRTDITDRKKSEEDFKEINFQLENSIERANLAVQEATVATHAKGEFLANMSHEIRTPMTAILGFSELLSEHECLASAPKECIDAICTIKRNGEHLLQIINDILDLSKIEAGKIEIEQVECSPFEIVAYVQSLIRVRADAKGLDLKTKYHCPIPETIFTDPTRLRQILINFLGNAIKFTESGEVKIAVRFIPDHLPESMLQFEITDTGIGMTEDQMDKLFQPFVQADTSTTRKFGGTGLGLSISKRFSELLGGEITIESIPNQGTTFFLKIPTGNLDDVTMINNPDDATVLKPSKEKLLQEAKPIPKLDGNILLAEDGPDNQRLISFVLKQAGLTVELAENGAIAVGKALRKLDEGNPFDVILMDMQMPVQDGYAATAALRNKSYDGTIIALTAHAMRQDREACLDAGCDDFLSKPIDRPHFFATIAQYLKSNGGLDSQITHTPQADPPIESDPLQETTDSIPEVLQSQFSDDAEFAPLIKEFVGNLPNRLSQMSEALENIDHKQLSSLAHQLKGAAGSYGYPSISEMAKSLEFAAKDNDIEAERLAIHNLTKICDSAKRECNDTNCY